MDVSKSDLKKMHLKVIRVGGLHYTLHVKKKIKKGTLLGQAKHYNSTIEISSEQNRLSFVDTLIHEILHCIWYAHAINLVRDSAEFEEFGVAVISTSLLAVFEDNPWVLDLVRGEKL